MSTNLNFHADDFTGVIWVQTGFIGDILLTTAAMQALHVAKPNLPQHLITTRIGVMALSGHPILTSIHEFSKRDGFWGPMAQVRRTIRSLSISRPVILQPHKSLRSTLLSLSLGYPIITFQETTGSLLAWRTRPRVGVLHEADRIAVLLEALAIPRHQTLGFRPVLPMSALPSVASALKNQGHLDVAPPHQKLRWIALAPGSVWATKRWPAAKFASLAQLILDLPDTGVVLLGSTEEAPIANDIEDHCLRGRPGTAKRIINLSGKTTLSDLNGIYPHLTALVSNDSSPVHYASAFNIPTIAIFGATVPSMGFGPLADNSSTVEVQLTCRPCSDHGPTSCPLGHFKCMNDIEVSNVLAKLKMTLTTSHPSMKPYHDQIH